MVVYNVRWQRRDDVSSNVKGRRKVSDNSYQFTVLCKSLKDAVKCLEYLFYMDFQSNTGINIGDGETTFTRVSLDSREFHVKYLLMDDMHKPLNLFQIDKSLMKY